VDTEKAFRLELWDAELRPWFLHVIPDAIKSVSILGVLLLFWEGVALLRFLGYPDDLLQRLEKTHFFFIWIALVAISINFVLKLVISTWRK